MRAPRRGLNWIALGAGAVMGAGQAPFSLWWLALAACGVLIWALGQVDSLRMAAWRGWFGGVGYIAATHFWIVDPFFVEPWRHGWMAPFAVVGLAAGIALFWAMAGALAHGVAPGPRARALALIPALTLAELGRAYLFTGFPWAPVGSLWLEVPVAQVTAIGGVHGLSLLTLAVLGVPLALTGGARWIAAAGSAAVIAGLWVWGAGQLAATPPDTGRTVRIIQPNAAQHLKWDPEHMPIFFNRALEMTGAGDVPPDLIIWPETSVPALLDYADNLTQAMGRAARGAPVIFGVQRNEGVVYHNSMVALRDGSQQVYDKRHLVPFGEYVPFGDVLTRIGISHLASAQGYGYGPGPEGQPLLELGALGRGLPLICYEGIFPQDLRGFGARADWIVLITNDAWFGQLTMPYAHVDHARMRSIETGLPMLRAANTGISAVIDARGRVTARLGLGETGYFDAPLPGAGEETVYARAGDLPVLLLALVMLGICGLRRFAIDPAGKGA